MGDPVAEVAKTEGEEVKEEKVETPDASNTDVVNAIKDMKDTLTKENKVAPTSAEIRAALKEKSGFTDDQLNVVEGLQRASAKQLVEKTAALEAKVAWNDFKDELGGRIDPAVEKIMQDELKEYDVSLRGDKVLLKKIHFLAKGIIADKQEKARKAAGTDNNNNDTKVEGRRIVDNAGSSNGLETGGGGGGKGSGLSDQEKEMAKNMSISEADYARSKSTKIVSQLKGSK